jgi:site-specific recombinase XerD
LKNHQSLEHFQNGGKMERNIDPDIPKLLLQVQVGHHSVRESIDRFLESLPGYEYRFHHPLTIKSYKRSLLLDPRCFINYCKKISVEDIDIVGKDNLEFYKTELLNEVNPQTAQKYINAVRQLFKFIHKIGWIVENPAADIELPKPASKRKIEIIRPEVVELLMNGDFGFNPFTRTRNKLVLCLFVRRGMHPKEIPGIKLEHIEPYHDLAVISVCGKKDHWREVMLDPNTMEALKEYAVERGKYAAWRGTNDEHLILASNPTQTGSYKMSIGGVSEIVKRMARQLKKEGCLFSLKNVTPNIMRHTAETADWERAEHLPVHHPEMSITAQYGNSPRVALKHYVVRSRRNSYMLIKGGSILDNAREGDANAINKLSSMNDLLFNFPKESSFTDFGNGI